MATLSVQEIVNTGLEPTMSAAASGGDEFPNDDRTFFFVKNGDGLDHTVTIAAQKSTVRFPNFGELGIDDIAVVVTAGEERLINAPPGSHNDGDGKAQVTYDAVTSVTVAAIKVPRA